MTYKTELHCHTSEGSGCSSESTADTIERYIKLGYTTAAVTNHFSDDDGRKFEYHAFVDHIFDVTELAKKCAAGRLNIISGIELRLNENNNDYLVYGVTRELMHSVERGFFNVDVSDAHDFFRKNGCVFIQAHPMRWGITTTHPDDVDGYEIINTHYAWDSHNEVATLWAKTVKPDGIMTAGTDHHDLENVPSACIVTDFPITTDELLVRTLLEKNFRIQL